MLGKCVKYTFRTLQEQWVRYNEPKTFWLFTFQGALEPPLFQAGLESLSPGRIRVLSMYHQQNNTNNSKKTLVIIELASTKDLRLITKSTQNIRECFENIPDLVEFIQRPK